MNCFAKLIRSRNNVFYKVPLKKSKSKIPIAINKILVDAEVETDAIQDVQFEETSTNTCNVLNQDQATNTTDLLKTSNCLEVKL